LPVMSLIQFKCVIKIMVLNLVNVMKEYDMRRVNETFIVYLLWYWR
jgi:hypothetical protein